MLKKSITTVMDMPVEHLYNVLLDVDHYKDFLPWCKDANVLRRFGSYLEAQMTISFATFEESYISQVFFEKHGEDVATINIASESDLFESMRSSWHLQRVVGGTEVTFEISLQFKNKILNKVASIFFLKACNKVMKAFEARAMTLYSTRTISK